MSGISSIASSVSLSVSELNEATVDVGFTTKVGGKTYDAAVTYAAGEYVASDSRLDGAEASGTSLQAAENGLVTRIDVLV
jgi:hypothetical protein